MIHGRRQSTRCRIEILHLLRYDLSAMNDFRHFNRVIQGTARMSGYQIWHQILFLIQFNVLFRE